VHEITLYSPSPQPSPMKGEGVFLTFYESIKNNICYFFVFKPICVYPVEFPLCGTLFERFNRVNLCEPARHTSGGSVAEWLHFFILGFDIWIYLWYRANQINPVGKFKRDFQPPANLSGCPEPTINGETFSLAG